jgi:hypothetical protein
MNVKCHDLLAVEPSHQAKKIQMSRGEGGTFEQNLEKFSQAYE